MELRWAERKITLRTETDKSIKTTLNQEIFARKIEGDHRMNRPLMFLCCCGLLFVCGCQKSDTSQEKTAKSQSSSATAGKRESENKTPTKTEQESPKEPIAKEPAEPVKEPAPKEPVKTTEDQAKIRAGNHPDDSRL